VRTQNYPDLSYSMRIIAGKYKNRAIYTALKGMKKNYRPTTTKVRAAAFNLLVHSPLVPQDICQDATVVDLCCGSGSFGFEALSRGASKVYFVDKDPEAIKLVRHNAASLQIPAVQTEFMLRDATLASKGFLDANIVFIDPPYSQNACSNILSSIAQENLAREHIVFLEADLRNQIELPMGWHLLMQREYGNTKLLVLQYHIGVTK
jgi:16S rRNA (guanine966-N2)-methyltransferase